MLQSRSYLVPLSFTSNNNFSAAKLVKSRGTSFVSRAWMRGLVNYRNALYRLLEGQGIEREWN